MLCEPPSIIKSQIKVRIRIRVRIGVRVRRCDLPSVIKNPFFESGERTCQMNEENTIKAVEFRVST